MAARARSRTTLAACIAVGLCATTARAQTTQDNLAKYARLRQRLVTEFTSVGPAQGQGQPAQERSDQLGFIRWSDSTIFLGWYIGVLASEYALLTNPLLFPGATNGSAGGVNQTLQELYYALLAMERLDEVADAAFPAPCTTTPALNGFFLRDDVPADFHQNFAPLTLTRSDYVDPTLTNKEMSQDQVYHLLIGLASVKRFVPASVTVQGKSLRAWAMTQTQRIGQHISSNGWIIKNPACNRTVNRGENAAGYSAGTRLALGFATDGAFLPTSPFLSETAWASLRSTSNPAYNDEDNLHMALAIAAVGNGWGNTTAQDLATLATTQDWPAYPLLHRALHGNGAIGFCTSGSAMNARARVMLDELPAAGEPSHPAGGGPAVHGFTSTHRFVRGKAQAYVGSPGSDGLRYSGLDFMLLHNMYALATPATWQLGPGVSPCQADGGVNLGNPDAGSPGPVDAGHDGGGAQDAGPAPDGGPAQDAGEVPDGGSAPDAGELPDGGTAPDGGALPDAGIPGTPGPGGDDAIVGSGCGCSAASAGPASLLLLLAALRWTRRNRRPLKPPR